MISVRRSKRGNCTSIVGPTVESLSVAAVRSHIEFGSGQTAHGIGLSVYTVDLGLPFVSLTALAS